MSADNWTICPRCKEETDKTLEKSYGKIPLEEFINSTKESTDEKLYLREDYQIGLEGDCLVLRYHGSCRMCNLKLFYKDKIHYTRIDKEVSK